MAELYQKADRAESAGHFLERNIAAQCGVGTRVFPSAHAHFGAFDARDFLVFVQLK
ncbi:MAG: hypothetical protein QFF03_19815 [Pseudomonadota bacterium]|nr:hypothetical protein [Pseudomonadota bacterium]